MFNERDLRYLIAIADSGSLRAASECMFVTQPALTKCVERLQSDLGVSLFHREGRHLVLTPEGKLMVSRSRNILSDMNGARRELRDYAKGTVGHLRIGAAATIMEELMPDVLCQLIADYPGISFELSIGMNDVLRQALDADQLDIVVGPTSRAEAYDCVNLLDDPVVVVASVNHPLAERPVQPEDLVNHAWILPNPNVATRAWLEKRLNEMGLTSPQIRIEVNSLALMPALIARSQLLSFMSSRIVGRDGAHQGLVGLSIPDLEYRRSFGILTRRESYVSTAAKLLINYLQSACLS